MDAGSGTPEPRDPLVPLVGALKIGNWPGAAAFVKGGLSGGASRDRALAFVLASLLIQAQRQLAFGRVSDAERVCDEAAKILPPQLASARPDGRRLAPLVLAPRLTAGHNPLLIRVVSIVGREQMTLDHLRKRLLLNARPRDHVIEACIQYMGEVHYWPWSYPDDAAEFEGLPPVEISRTDLLLRATYLRQFAFPQKGQVSKTVWDNLHAGRGVWAAALERLASRPLAPWRTAGPGALIDVRLGHRRAWEHARRWRKDFRND